MDLDLVQRLHQREDTRSPELTATLEGGHPLTGANALKALGAATQRLLELADFLLERRRVLKHLQGVRGRAHQLRRVASRRVASRRVAYREGYDRREGATRVQSGAVVDVHGEILMRLW
jgi:hypothetical protein